MLQEVSIWLPYGWQQWRSKDNSQEKRGDRWALDLACSQLHTYKSRGLPAGPAYSQCEQAMFRTRPLKRDVMVTWLTGDVTQIFGADWSRPLRCSYAADRAIRALFTFHAHWHWMEGIVSVYMTVNLLLLCSVYATPFRVKETRHSFIAQIFRHTGHRSLFNIHFSAKLWTSAKCSYRKNPGSLLRLGEHLYNRSQLIPKGFKLV